MNGMPKHSTSACDSRRPAITICFFDPEHWTELVLPHGRFSEFIKCFIGEVRSIPQSYSKASMSFLTISILFLVVLTSLSHGSPLPTSSLKPGTKNQTNATYVSSIDQCPSLPPRQTPPTNVHDLLVIVTSMWQPLLILFS